MMSVLSLWLPILLAGVGTFFASFLSWMILQLHKGDWLKVAGEDELLATLRKLNLPPQSYMIPSCDNPKEMQSPEFQQKWAAGPRGVLTIFADNGGMGRNLAWTMLMFIVINFTLGYLGTIAFQPGAEFMNVFRFFATAGLLAYLPGIVMHSIWFQCRIVGHVFESLAFALISAVIFAFLWPGAA